MIAEHTAPTTSTQSAATAASQADASAAFAAVGTLREKLQAKGFDDQTIAFILGRFINKVANTVLDEVVTTLSDVVASPEVGGIVDDAERQAKIETLFKERTGKTIQQRREEVAERMVAEFEKTATAAPQV